MVASYFDFRVRLFRKVVMRPDTSPNRALAAHRPDTKPPSVVLSSDGYEHNGVIVLAVVHSRALVNGRFAVVGCLLRPP